MKHLVSDALSMSMYGFKNIRHFALTLFYHKLLITIQSIIQLSEYLRHTVNIRKHTTEGVKSRVEELEAQNIELEDRVEKHNKFEQELQK